MKKIVLCFVFTIFFLWASSRENVSIGSSPQPVRNLNSRAGNCVQGNANIDLDINNVRAKLLITGDLWWDRTSAKYGVPKLTKDQIKSGQQQPSPLFAGAIWISGKVSGNLKMASIKYSTSGSQAFWPGPLKKGNISITQDVCGKFNKFWSVKAKEDIEPALGGKYSDAIKEWPGRGNPYLIAQGKYTAEELSDPLAPFYDADGDCIYDYTKGDLPAIKQSGKGSCASGCQFAYASQMIFWVINDVGNDHSGPASAPIGVQLNCLAFAFESTDDLNNMTFYSYEIHNKSNVDIEETYMTQFFDSDLGGYSDDYVGCDTSRSLGYCYNADDFDATSGTAIGYNSNVPIFGADFFEGPKKDNGQPIGLSSFVYFINNTGQEMSDPQTETEYRNFQEGKTRTGRNLTVSNDCIQTGKPTTKFCFYGDPSKNGEWTMCDAGFTPIDLRFAQNSGPFTMKSGTFETVTIGLIFVQPPVGTQTSCRPAMSYLQAADDKAQRLFDFCFKKSSGPDAPELKIQELSNQLNFTIENLEVSNNKGERYNEKDIDIPLGFGNKDTTYRFEGYAIYQIASANAVSTFADLQDNTKAKLLKLMDIKNNVVKAVNYSRQNINNHYITSVENIFNFQNNGIEREFTVTDDLFQSEGKKFLVNNKTYYYAAISLAHNNYKILRDSQLKQVIFSPRIKIFSGIPHDDNFWGINTKAKFGEFIPVKRIQGQGHGNYYLDLFKSGSIDDEKDIMNIISPPYSKDIITYKGGQSPILVRVNDPYKLKNAKFQLTIMDTPVGGVGNPKKFGVNTSFWELKDVTNNVTIAGERNIDREFSQSIFGQLSSSLQSYGISVGISIADSIDTVAPSPRPVYDYIGGSITFTDSSKQWLRFLADEDGKKYVDWIRSGSTPDMTGQFVSSYNFVNNKRVYTDSLGKFGKILGKTWAPYCLTANTNIGSTRFFEGYESYGPAFKWRRVTGDSTTMTKYGEGPENNLDSIFSFDLVITPDKNKWTQGVVFETGESQQFNEFNAMKGQIRKSPSIDENGAIISGDIGRGFFPGYAINLETGVRVNIYFGENSRFQGKNGANMRWDPDSLTETALGNPIYGGFQFIYVLNSEYDKGEADRDVLINNFNAVSGAGNTAELSKQVAAIYKKIAWTCIPLTIGKFPMYNANGDYQIPTEVRVKIRVQKPYAFYNDGGSQTSIYEFSTDGLAPELKKDLTASAFEKMTIVPNPYNAYSIYESSAAQNVIKIVNVPKNSTISIFTTDGILVRKLKFNETADYTYSGSSIDNSNVDNAVTWDMRTTSGVLIASGTYYINVESPGIGNKVLKLFATMRSADVSNF